MSNSRLIFLGRAGNINEVGNYRVYPQIWKKMKRIDQNEKSLHRGASLELEKCRLILQPLKFFFCQLPISQEYLPMNTKHLKRVLCLSHKFQWSGKLKFRIAKFDIKKQRFCLHERSELQLKLLHNVPTSLDKAKIMYFWS